MYGHSEYVRLCVWSVWSVRCVEYVCVECVECGVCGVYGTIRIAVDYARLSFNNSYHYT